MMSSPRDPNLARFVSPVNVTSTDRLSLRTVDEGRMNARSGRADLMVTTRYLP